MKKDKIDIPVVFCHDENYVVPSSVAITSLLENSSTSHFYKLFILHDNISSPSQLKLLKEVSRFKNCSLEFVDMTGQLSEKILRLKNKAHYSKEIFYKFLIPTIITQYDHVIVSDVDVVFLGDVSEEFIKFKTDCHSFHFAGVRMVNKMDHFLDCYKKDFSSEELVSIKNGVGAGYMFLNIEAIRKDGVVEKYFEFLENNYCRLIQPEQDVMNICSAGKIKKLNLKNMVCSYVYDLYDERYLEDEEFYSSQEISCAMKSPIQLHYATHIKPWLDLKCPRSDIWLRYLLKTNFYEDYIEKFYVDKRHDEKIKIKNIIDIKVKLSKVKKLQFMINKIKENEK